MNGPARPPTMRIGPAPSPNWIIAALRRRIPEDHVRLYETASGFRDSWWGLARYWRKRRSRTLCGLRSHLRLLDLSTLPPVDPTSPCG